MNRPVCTSLIIAMLVMVLAGCSHYSSVPPNPDPVKIAVLPVINNSDLPQIIAPLSRNIREKIAHSPNWELVAEEQSRAKIQITILSLDKRAMARDPRDTGRPLSFHEEIKVAVEWISDQPAPWGKNATMEVSSDHIVYAQPSLTDSRTSATAGLAERLSEKILQRLDWDNIQ